jgi:hypothetical protein
MSLSNKNQNISTVSNNILSSGESNDCVTGARTIEVTVDVTRDTISINDSEGEGQAPSRKNFSEEEDEQLCHSYLFVALDAIHGTEQKGETFWSRIKEHFDGCLGDNIVDRSARALPARWQIVNKAVNKYAGCLSQVERSNASGSNSESNVSYI